MNIFSRNDVNFSSQVPLFQEATPVSGRVDICSTTNSNKNSKYYRAPTECTGLLYVFADLIFRTTL